MQNLIEVLQEKPQLGTPLGDNCYKARLSIASKSKGKSGGARVITHLFITQDIVILLAIYDKGEQANILQKTVRELLKLIV